MTPDEQGLTIEVSGPCSIARQQVPVRGRLQVHVAEGSQYAVWRQFPGGIYFDVTDPAGTIHAGFDLELSLSDDPETHERYARMPADRVMGEDFELDAFAAIVRALAGPGAYQLRARYQEWASEWITVDLGP